MGGKCKKKPIVIDYYYIGTLREAWYGLPEWLKQFGDSFSEHFITNEPVASDSDIEIKVKTKEGTSYAITPRDVILRGVSGEYYPCKKDIFHQTYDIVEDEFEPDMEALKKISKSLQKNDS